MEMVSGFCGPPDGFAAGGRYLFPIEILCLWMEKNKRNLSPKEVFNPNTHLDSGREKKKGVLLSLFLS